MTCQREWSKGICTRTKYFFGARYLWTKEQIAGDSDAAVAHGVRTDVSAAPQWLHDHVERRLVQCGILPQGPQPLLGVRT